MTINVSTDLITEITQLLYHEAEPLDGGQYEAWLALLASDVIYTADIRSDIDPAAADPIIDPTPSDEHRLSYFHDDYALVQTRVRKIRTGLLKTENPPSRTVRMISNVQVLPTEVPDEHVVHRAFLLYRHRRQRQVEILAGHRHDRWRRTVDGWRLAARDVRFAANVLPTKSLSLFY